jgi:hypothetical protein
MKAQPRPEILLQQMARIQQMERGKLCRLGTGGYFNHQTWTQGRNVVRYVPREQVAGLQKAIAGYQRFLKLTQAYADAVIRRTRRQPPAAAARPAVQKGKKPNKP